MSQRILIVAAPFYQEIHALMHPTATQWLRAKGYISQTIEVGGALEVAAAIRMFAHDYDGFLALGCIVRGETYHYEIVCNTSAAGLQMLGIGTPQLLIGNALITAETYDQALARAEKKTVHALESLQGLLRLQQVSSLSLPEEIENEEIDDEDIENEETDDE